MRSRLIVVSLVLVGVLVHPAPGHSSEPAFITGGIARYVVERGDTLTSARGPFRCRPDDHRVR